MNHAIVMVWRRDGGGVAEKTEDLGGDFVVKITENKVEVEVEVEAEVEAEVEVEVAVEVEVEIDAEVESPRWVTRVRSSGVFSSL